MQRFCHSVIVLTEAPSRERVSWSVLTINVPGPEAEAGIYPGYLLPTRLTYYGLPLYGYGLPPCRHSFQRIKLVTVTAAAPRVRGVIQWDSLSSILIYAASHACTIYHMYCRVHVPQLQAGAT